MAGHGDLHAVGIPANDSMVCAFAQHVKTRFTSAFSTFLLWKLIPPPHPMCLIISVANSLHLTFFAPVMRRSKS